MIQKTEAIVLKTLPFRSSSLIVTFYTEFFGKIRGLAKGVRGENEKRGMPFELFTRLEIIFYEKTRSDLHLVSDAVITEPYDSLRSNLESIAVASYFADLVDELTEVHDANEKIFTLLDFGYRYLASLPPKRVARLFETNLLAEIGWLPYLEACVQCGANAEQGFFSARQGALVCAKCAPTFPEALPLSREALSILRYYTRHLLEESIKLGISRPAGAELEKLMDRFFLERLNRPLKTRQFLEKIKPVLK